MKPIKQTVYLPVNNGLLEVRDFITKQKIEEVKNAGELYCFTTEQLNKYTANVIKSALETAAEKAKIPQFKSRFLTIQENKQSITNTFEETYKKFEV